jgi:hypothetical protein
MSIKASVLYVCVSPTLSEIHDKIVHSQTRCAVINHRSSGITVKILHDATSENLTVINANNSEQICSYTVTTSSLATGTSPHGLVSPTSYHFSHIHSPLRQLRDKHKVTGLQSSFKQRLIFSYHFSYLFHSGEMIHRVETDIVTMQRGNI